MHCLSCISVHELTSTANSPEHRNNSASLKCFTDFTFTLVNGWWGNDYVSVVIQVFFFSSCNKGSTVITGDKQFCQKEKKKKKRAVFCDKAESHHTQPTLPFFLHSASYPLFWVAGLFELEGRMHTETKKKRKKRSYNYKSPAKALAWRKEKYSISNNGTRWLITWFIF